MNRNQINFPEHLHISPLRFTRNVGVREAIILGVGILSAFILLTILYQRVGLLQGVLVAAAISVFSITLAFLPIRGYHLEQYLIILISYYFQRRRYIHKTAYSVWEQVVVEPPADIPADQQPPVSPSPQPSEPAPAAPPPFAPSAPLIMPKPVAPFPLRVILAASFAYFLLLAAGTLLLLYSRENVIRIPIENFN